MGTTFKGFSGEVYAEGRYTVVIEFTKYDPGWFWTLGYEDFALIAPPEIEGSREWKDQVGTGPFMLKEYAIGSHFTYERNPNYWKTTIINGVEYQLPFVDELVCPIIPDAAIQVAALRTGKLDYFSEVPTQYWDNLEETALGIQSSKYAGASGEGICFMTTDPPFDSREVRRALMVGTDMKACADLLGLGPLPIHWWPIWPGHPETIRTPLEELPAETRLLYDYNPELARQMLADALGHDDGLEIEMTVKAWSHLLDMAALVAYQWEKIGVEVEILSTEPTVYSRVKHDSQFTDCIDTYMGTGNPLMLPLLYLETGVFYNFGDYSDEWYDEFCVKMRAEFDEDKRNALIKEAAVYVVNEVPFIPLRPHMQAVYWWPWLKNYYGEVMGRTYHVPLFYAWIDQDLKAEMGY